MMPLYTTDPFVHDFERRERRAKAERFRLIAIARTTHKEAPRISLKTSARYARYLVGSLATVAFGLNAN